MNAATQATQAPDRAHQTHHRKADIIRLALPYFFQFGFREPEIFNKIKGERINGI